MTREPRCRLSTEERRALEALVADPTLPRGHRRRLQVIALSDSGTSGVEIAKRLGLSPGQVSRIRRRFERSGIPGLADRPKLGRRDHAVSAEKIELILELAASDPPAGERRWSTRRIGLEVGLTSATVAKVLRAQRAPAQQHAAAAAHERRLEIGMDARRG